MHLKHGVAILCELLSTTSCSYPSTDEFLALKSEVFRLRLKVDSLKKHVLVKSYTSKRAAKIKTARKKSARKQTLVEVPTPITPSVYSEPASSEAVEFTRSTDKAVESRTTTYERTYSSQWQAITKERRQCSRTARSNGYCWQHGG